MRNHLGYMVNLALQDTPELRGHPAVSEFLSSGGLVADRRSLADYTIVKTRSGRNDLIRAEFEGADVCLKKFGLADGNSQKAYLKEVQSVQSLCHPFIISYDAVFEQEGSMYVQMPFYNHGSLKDWVTTTNPDAATRRVVLRQTLLAISFIHSRGMAHCDLKGENVLITDEGTPKLCDFELSRDVGVTMATTRIGGTLGFIAPEVVSRKSKPCEASDMFAYGVLLLNSVHPPADMTQYPLVDASAAEDPALREVVIKLLSLQPSSRPTAVTLQAEPYFTAEAWDEWGRLDVGQGEVFGSCRQEMLAADASVLGVPNMQAVIADVDYQMAQLGDLNEQQRNHRFAFFLYTIELGAVYSILNRTLRQRDARGARFTAFQPYLWHLMAALKELPDQRCTVYRGIDEVPNITEYDSSRRIHWSGFSSTSVDAEKAKEFARGSPNGIVFKIEVHNAKDIRPFSCYVGPDGEGELLLSPNMVSPEPIHICHQHRSLRSPARTGLSKC